MKGERRDGKEPHLLVTGEYTRCERDDRWYMVPPDGVLCAISPRKHTVTEHNDGTITVSPSIRRFATHDAPREWHGYLERGVWRTV